MASGWVCPQCQTPYRDVPVVCPVCDPGAPEQWKEHARALMRMPCAPKQHSNVTFDAPNLAGSRGKDPSAPGGILHICDDCWPKLEAATGSAQARLVDSLLGTIFGPAAVDRDKDAELEHLRARVAELETKFSCKCGAPIEDCAENGHAMLARKQDREEFGEHLEEELTRKRNECGRLEAMLADARTVNAAQTIELNRRLRICGDLTIENDRLRRLSRPRGGR